MAGGRPTDYSEELAKRVCDLVATSEKGLDDLSAEYDWFPVASTIHLWAFKNEQFSQMYMQAKRFQAQLLAQSVDRILHQKVTYIDKEGNERIDAASVAMYNNIAKGRQWTAARLAPKVWGDIKEIEDVKNELARNQEEVRKLRAELDAVNRKEY